MDMFYAKSENKSWDLDDPKTYKYCKYKNFNAAQLFELAKCKMGKALYYIEFFHPDIFLFDRDGREGCGYQQVIRIKQFCFWFSQEWNEHIKDTPENRLWLKKFIFKFEEETENLC